MLWVLFLFGEINLLKIEDAGGIQDFAVIDDKTALLLYKDHLNILNPASGNVSRIALASGSIKLEIGKDGIYIFNKYLKEIYRFDPQSRTIRKIHPHALLWCMDMATSPYDTSFYFLSTSIERKQYLYTGSPENPAMLGKLPQHEYSGIERTLRGPILISKSLFPNRFVIYHYSKTGTVAFPFTYSSPFTLSPSGYFILYTSRDKKKLLVKGEKYAEYPSLGKIYRISWKIPEYLGIISGSYLLIISDTTHPHFKISCPSCGYENEFNYNFCINCGHPLKDVKIKKLVNFREENILKNLEIAFNNLNQKIQEERKVVYLKKEEKVEKPSETAPIEEKNKPVAKEKSQEVKKEKPGTTHPIKTKLPEIAKKFKKRRPFPEMETPSFFEVPKGDVVRSLTVFVSGGGAFATEEEGYSPMGTFLVGFGDIFQVEFSTLGVINTLLTGSSVLPALSFKMNLTNTFRDRLHLGKDFPIISIGLRGTWWNSYYSNGITYSTRYAYLFSVIEKQFGNLTVVGGISICDTRAKTSVSPMVVRNPTLLYGGAEFKMNENSYIVFEISQLSGYRFHPDGSVSGDDLVKGMWWSIGGKTYVTKWLIVNASARFDAEEGVRFQGPADAKLWAGISLLLPLDYYYSLMR